MADDQTAARLAVHDALGQRGFTRLAPVSGSPFYAGVLQRHAGAIPVAIEVTDLDFVRYPRIRIEPDYAMPDRMLPHLQGVDRSICYYAKGSVILDRYDPGGTVLQCLDQAETVLRNAIDGRSDADFSDEFNAYWGSTFVYVALPTDYVGPARICAVRLGRGEREVLVVTTGRTWFGGLDRYTGRRQGLGQPVAVVAVDQPLTFSANDTWPPTTLPELNTWLRNIAPDLVGKLETVLRTEPGHTAAILVRAPNGLFCYQIGVPRHMRRQEFLENRRRHLPRIMARQRTSTPVERFAGVRVDEAYLFGRNFGGMKNLAGKKILLIGCGTIGGFLAQQLAQCGAGASRGSLTLVDPDVLTTGNLGRHLLGAPYLGQKKAEACAAFLKEQLPPLAIEGHAGDVLTQPLPWKRYDLVIDATGEEALSLTLNERAVQARPALLPHVFVWLVGNGAVAQCLLTGDPDRACLKCLKPALAGPPRFPTLRTGVATEKVANIACGDADYIPFPVSRSVAAAALACDLVLDWANGDPGDRFRSLTLDAKRGLTVPASSPDPIETCPACGHAA
ncbi:ThiF family adenylyltransferase [Methylobacterium radiotolerans]|uniref:ThiF family adenylyltransferase n=1 Tax=Methylobacterium radiotolerans TaxID=31998 RepID=UPI001F46631F|nr:ThiF family adenylyltransferase [Methylobacterium radiotolerans]UIY45312.1 ThiF family adenylyltransferase [Methylobacterium radiotolerans]